MAMIVGGINLAGGQGTVSGAVFGALLIGLIQNIVTLSPLGNENLKFIQGIIILAAVIVSTVSDNRNRRGVSRKSKRLAAEAANTDSQ
jgi:ribose/xylose/arabinose/galactoside ABC-type transport system permease subunit